MKDRSSTQLLLLTGFALASILQGGQPASAESQPLASPSFSAPTSAVILEPKKVVDGGIVRIEFAGPLDAQASEFEGEFNGIKFPFVQITPGKFGALLGVPHNLAPQHYSVRVSRGSGKKVEILTSSLEVVSGNYPSEVLKVSNRHINPSKKNLMRIKREIREVSHLYQQVTKKKYWSGPFLTPIPSEYTSPYGTKRVFNGQLKSFHNGIDLKAATGTEVRAPAGAKVVLAKDLFFSGGTVILDHGYGVMTLYAHLSEIKVKVGTEVKTGDLLGLSGMTGRVTGPHLHWAAILHRQKVNPRYLTEVVKW
jgi:hypothetical protein